MIEIRTIFDILWKGFIIGNLRIEEDIVESDLAIG